MGTSGKGCLLAGWIGVAISSEYTDAAVPWRLKFLWLCSFLTAWIQFRCVTLSSWALFKEKVLPITYNMISHDCSLLPHPMLF